MAKGCCVIFGKLIIGNTQQSGVEKYSLTYGTCNKEYASEKEVQEVFLTNLKALITVLIRIFTAQAVFDFHSYMDYVGGSNTAAEAYQQMMADYQRATKES